VHQGEAGARAAGDGIEDPGDAGQGFSGLAAPVRPVGDQALVLHELEDAHRPAEPASKKAKLVQKKVHEIVGSRLDKVALSEGGDGKSRKPADQLLFNIYQIFSYYVHGRYPESMDLYGGRPGRFHLHGMNGTPKDGENIVILEHQMKMGENVETKSSIFA